MNMKSAGKTKGTEEEATILYSATEF